MPDPIPVEGPVELIDGKLILRIPLDMGGVGIAAFALGIGEVDSRNLNVAIQPWLAQKLRIGPGSIVCVSVDTAEGNFRITRSAANDERLGQRRNYWMLLSSRMRTTKWLAALNASAAVAAVNDEPLGQRRNYWMLSSSRTRTTKWLAALNASAAVAAVAVLPISSLEYPSHLSDRGAQNHVFPTWLVYLTAALFGLAATAHWQRWALWWLVQGMAVALPLVIILLSLT
jgi:hypothetical protein